MATRFDDVIVDRSPESCAVRILLDLKASPEIVVVVVRLKVVSIRQAHWRDFFDKISLKSGKDLIGNGRKNRGSKRDWWCKQDSGGGSESGGVKDHVMEWIGSEIKKERLKNEWITLPSPVENARSGLKFEDKKYILNCTMLVNF